VCGYYFVVMMMMLLRMNGARYNDVARRCWNWRGHIVFVVGVLVGVIACWKKRWDGIYPLELTIEESLLLRIVMWWVLSDFDHEYEHVKSCCLRRILWEDISIVYCLLLKGVNKASLFPTHNVFDINSLRMIFL